MMAVSDEKFDSVREARAALEAIVVKVYGDNEWTQADLKKLAGAAGFSVQTTKDLVNPEAITPGKLSMENMLPCLKVIRDGEVTNYKDIGDALGFTNYYHQVAKFLAEAKGIAALAAPVIGAAGKTHHFESPRKFDVGGEWVNRDPYLEQRGIKFEVSGRDDENLLIAKSQYVSGETLKQRLDALKG